MKLFSAVGLVIAIIGLKMLMPEVFTSFQATLLKFFELNQDIMAKAQTLLHSGGF